MNKKGSLGYQMMSALKTIFHPGRSRFLDKMHRRDKDVIRGIGTMRNDSANLHQFARFIRTTWPDVKDLERVTPEMAQAYISELVRRERSGGWIGRVCSAIRKMDTACRKSGIFPKSMPALLPYKAKGGPGSFHAQTKTAAYTTEQAHLIIASIESVDPAISRLLRLMQAAGLRVNEASRLRAQDIDLSSKTISLNQSSNINRTKGGRSRVVHYQPESQDFIQEMQTLGEKNPTGHIFKDRNSLPDRARAQVSKTCQRLQITCLGTHGFRKTYASAVYKEHRKSGDSDPQALIKTARELGHSRAEVTRQSYVSADERK